MIEPFHYPEPEVEAQRREGHRPPCMPSSPPAWWADDTATDRDGGGRAALLSTLLALGTPLSWKKTHLAEINTWLGFVIHPSIPRKASKHIKVVALLEDLDQRGGYMSAKAIEKAMGRIQWATVCCPVTKLMLQPFWAWKMAVQTMGHPPKVVRMLACLLKELFTLPFEQYSPFLPKSPWWGCSDASASAQGDAYIGDGAVMPPIPPRRRSSGSTTRSCPPNIRGHSKMATPRNESRHLSCWVPCSCANT